MYVEQVYYKQWKNGKKCNSLEYIWLDIIMAVICCYLERKNFMWIWIIYLTLK